MCVCVGGGTFVLNDFMFCITIITKIQISQFFPLAYLQILRYTLFTCVCVLSHLRKETRLSKNSPIYIYT